MIIYSGPMEEDTENPTKAFLKDIIFNKQEDYWKKGGGDSCISIEGCNERLIFFYDNPYGFFIMRHPDYLVIYNQDVDIKTITHRVGGEPMQVPTCSYVTREMAYKIIISFIEKKEIPKFISWVDLYEIDFEYEY